MILKLIRWFLILTSYFNGGASGPVLIGTGIGTADVDVPYSLVVGRSASYTNGELFPRKN